VSGVFRGPQSQLLVKEAATEAALKAQPLASYRILHLAAHGIMSTKVRDGDSFGNDPFPPRDMKR